MMIMMLSKGEHNLPSLLRDLYKNVISMKKLTVSKNKNPFYDLQFSGSVQMLKIPSFHRLYQWDPPEWETEGDPFRRTVHR